jgi:hypothetical protein
MHAIAPSDFDLLVALAHDAGADPLDWALILYEESGWDPSRKNGSGAPYYGLNQMGRSEAHGVGFSGSYPDAWLALSIADQLPYVAAFFRQKRTAVPTAFASAAHLLAANFLPGRMVGHDDPADIDYPLTRAGDADGFYEANAIYDVDRKGAISIRSLGSYLTRVVADNPHDTAALHEGVTGALGRAGILTIPEVTIISTPGGKGGAAVLFLLVLGAAILMNRSA